jgi:hypothetical protein
VEFEGGEEEREERKRGRRGREGERERGRGFSEEGIK